MATLTIVLFVVISLGAYHLSPISNIKNDIKLKYSTCSRYAKIEIVNKNTYVQYNRLIFEVDTKIKDKIMTCEISPKDFNSVNIGDEVYVFINDRGDVIYDICDSEELEDRLKILRSFPLRITIDKMEGY